MLTPPTGLGATNIPAAKQALRCQEFFKMADQGCPIMYRMPGEHIYDGMRFPQHFPAQSLDKIKKFDCRDGDVIVITYPKAGTTWMQEIVYLLKNEANTDMARAINHNDRVLFLEYKHPGEVPVVDYAASVEGPRLLKAHVRPYFFQKPLENPKVKFVIVMRNVKDNLVSFYNFYKNNAKFGFKGTFSDFLELFKRKHLLGGDWFDFNLDWWQMRDRPNVFIAKFEDMKKDIRKEIQRVAEFLEVQPSPEQLDIISEHVSFDSMKTNKSVNREGSADITNFMRKGEVGDWKHYFNPRQQLYMEALLKEKLTGTGLQFDDEI